MAGNFRGVLIFIISWLTWQSQNFPRVKINAYGDIIMRWVDRWQVWSKTLWQHGQLFAVLAASNRSHYHLANGILRAFYDFPRKLAPPKLPATQYLKHSYFTNFASITCTIHYFAIPPPPTACGSSHCPHPCLFVRTCQGCQDTD